MPTMCAWIVQKYLKLPAVVKVNENLSPVSRACDLNRVSLSTIVCGSSSLLTQVTVVPTGTVRCAGTKLQLLISIVFSSADAGRPTPMARRATKAAAASSGRPTWGACGARCGCPRLNCIANMSVSGCAGKWRPSSPGRSPSAGQLGVGDRQRMRALRVGEGAQAEHVLQLVGRHGERAGRLGLAGFGLRIGGGPGG